MKLNADLIPLLIIVTGIAIFVMYPVPAAISLSAILILYVIKTNPGAGVACLIFCSIIIKSIYMYLLEVPSNRTLSFTVYTLPLFLVFLSSLQGKPVKYYLDKFIGIFIVFIFMLIGSAVFISSDTSYGLEKLMYFAFTLLGCLAINGAVTKSEEVSNFFKGYLVFSFLLLLFSLVTPMEHRLRLGDFFYNRFTTLGINPIWMARYFSYAILFNLYIIVKSRFNAFVTIFFSLVSLIYLYYMILSGSRGPLLGLIAGLLLFAFLYFRLNLKTIILSLLVLFIVFFSVKILLDSKENIERFTGNKDSISSSTNRLIAQLEAYELLKTNFILGGGFGSFNRYPLQYPHNVFTEILSECGLVGFVILLLLFFFTFMRVMKLDKKKVQNIILSAFLLAGFINANLSGHLGYNMMFWLGVYLVNHVYIIQKKEMNSIN